MERVRREEKRSRGVNKEETAWRKKGRDEIPWIEKGREGNSQIAGMDRR